MIVAMNIHVALSAGGDRYVEILTSSDPSQRGCQLSVRFSWSLEKADKFLTSMGAVVSWI